MQKNKTTVCVNTLVKNEERYLWFSVKSVIDHVDKILLWDTGSTDKTPEIIKALEVKYPDKIEVRYLKDVDPFEFTKVRQEMLDLTQEDWIMILDGDEVWWDGAMVRHIKFIQDIGSEYESLVTRYRNIVGDIYHYQDEKAGKYSIDGQEGHLSIRFINRKVPGLYFGKPHGQQGLFDSNKIAIQNRSSKKRKHMGLGFLHFTNVVRSSSRSKDIQVPKRHIKLKYELGNSLPLDFYYPEAFFEPKNKIVSSPWACRGTMYLLRSFLETPARKIKRSLLHSKSGY